MFKVNLFLLGAEHCYLLMAQLLSVLSLCLVFACQICNEVCKLNISDVNANICLMFVSYARLLRPDDLGAMATEENALTDGLGALRLNAGAEGSAKSAVANLAHDAMKNESAMVSGAKKDTMTGLRIMQIVCSDTFKASVCLTKASALVKDVGDEKLQLWKKNKIGAKVRLFFDGIDQEVTSDALRHAFLQFGQVMWLNQDDIDDQLKIDVARKRRRVMQRNSIGDLTSTCNFLRELQDVRPANERTANSARFAVSAARIHDRSQQVAAYDLREMTGFS